MSKGALEYYMAQDYPVEIRRIPESLGGGYSASIPHLGRMAFFADGDTVEEALAKLERVKRTLFQHMISQGRPIPPPPPLPEEETETYSGRLPLRIPKDLHRELAERAEANGCSINQYVTAALAKQLSGEQCAEDAVAKLVQRLEVRVTDVDHPTHSYQIQTPARRGRWREEYEDLGPDMPGPVSH